MRWQTWNSVSGLSDVQGNDNKITTTTTAEALNAAANGGMLAVYAELCSLFAHSALQYQDTVAGHRSSMSLNLRATQTRGRGPEPAATFGSQGETVRPCYAR